MTGFAAGIGVVREMRLEITDWVGCGMKAKAPGMVLVSVAQGPVSVKREVVIFVWV